VALFSVAANKKKIVAFLVAVALGSGALVLWSVQSTTAEAATETSKFKPGSLFANDPNFSAASADSLGTRELFFKMMLSVLLVIALGAGVIYISKKFLPRITNLPGKQIRIIETVHLGSRKAVHLIEIGNQRFLIGSTSEGITKLADVTYAFSEMDLSAQETDNNLRI
jgi:flagellar biosynthetic protein FliO